jgi:hypothetical protein
MNRFRTRRIKRFLTLLLSSLLVLLCILILLPSFLIPAHPFPTPSGEWQVGTSDILWQVPGQSARLAKVWYPTSTRKGQQSSYIDKRVLENVLPSLIERLNLPQVLIFSKFYLSRIKTPAGLNASLIQQNQLPVILFSPGLGGINILNTFYALEFASRGFIVIGINHPGSSAITLMENGAIAEFNPSSSSERDTVEQQVDNLSAIANTLLKLTAQPESILYQKIDANKIFALGHSTGVVASFLACGRDQRFSKCANLDGILERFTDMNYTTKKLLLMETDINPTVTQLLEHERAIQMLSKQADWQRVIFQQSEHLNFTDLPLVFKLSKMAGLVGETDSFELLSDSSKKLIEFFSN